MFFVNDIYGLQHVWEGPKTVVGARTEQVNRATQVRAVQAHSAPPLHRRDAPLQPPESGADAERQLLLFVHQIMSQPAVHVRATETLEHAFALLKRARVRHLPVTSAEDRVIGLLSERDLLRDQAHGINLSATRVEAGMTRQVLTVRPEATIRDAARVMFEAHVGSLPVVISTGKLNGVLTRSDILKAVVQFAPLELWG